MRFTLVAALVLVTAACGASHHAARARPLPPPGPFALRVVRLITHNRYEEAWRDLHPVDKTAAPFREYVACERRSLVPIVPVAMRVLGVRRESVALGDGTFVGSAAVRVFMRFRGGFSFAHTVHLVSSHGRWTWILPAWRYRRYRANICPLEPGSAPSAQSA
jgi:hypothetical protein